jgi:hypothetical protein
MFRYLAFLSFLFCWQQLWAQPKTDSLLAQVLTANQHPLLQQVLQDPGTYRLQIIYTQIDRDKQNEPSFTNYYFHYDPELYFNPASMVKMPLAFLAMEKLKALRKKEIDRNTTIQFDSSESWQRSLYRDTSAANGRPTIAHFIKRAFLISENDPYNRLYQFLGQGVINRSCTGKAIPMCGSPGSFWD